MKILKRIQHYHDARIKTGTDWFWFVVGVGNGVVLCEILTRINERWPA
jgi:hypothetical protein